MVGMCRKKQFYYIITSPLEYIMYLHEYKSYVLDRTSAKFRYSTNTLNSLAMDISLIHVKFMNGINIMMLPRN